GAWNHRRPPVRAGAASVGQLEPLAGDFEVQGEGGLPGELHAAGIGLAAADGEAKAAGLQHPCPALVDQRQIPGRELEGDSTSRTGREADALEGPQAADRSDAGGLEIFDVELNHLVTGALSGVA